MLLGLAALASPAAADINVIGYVDYDAQYNVHETVSKTKTVDIFVLQNFENGDSAAEATGVHNQRTSGNYQNRDCVGCQNTQDPNAAIPSGPPPDAPGGILAQITSSFLNNDGLVMWNQDVGTASNQANVITAAVVTVDQAFTEVFTAAAQHTEGNQSRVRGVAPTSQTNSAVISSSVNNNTGVTMLNQNAGFASNQYNSLGVALATKGATVALSEADLGQWNSFNITIEGGSIRTATIVNSINNNTGVTAVNQNVGNFNNQATMINFAGGVGTQ
jgi:hypothetical protein